MNQVQGKAERQWRLLLVVAREIQGILSHHQREYIGPKYNPVLVVLVVVAFGGIHSVSWVINLMACGRFG